MTPDQVRYEVERQGMGQLLQALASDRVRWETSGLACPTCSTDETTVLCDVDSGETTWTCFGTETSRRAPDYAARPVVTRTRCDGGTIHLARRLVLESPVALDRLGLL